MNGGKHMKDMTLTQIFEMQAKKTPDKVALVFDDREMTYFEVDRKATKLAKYLLENNVKKGDIVALQIERSFEMVLCIMAVLKTGAAYLPLNVNEPVERLNYLLSKSNARFILTNLKKPVSISAQYIDIVEFDYDMGGDLDLGIEVASDDLAYIIFTSGSTGEPKGVMVEHKSVVNFLVWRKEEYSLKDDDISILKHSYTFDFSVAELFSWFVTGSSLCILKQDEENNPLTLINKISEHKVTSINFITSALKLFLDYAENKDIVGKLRSLKYLYFGGEYLHNSLVEKFYNVFGRDVDIKLNHVYGTTETTIYSTFFSVNYDVFSGLSVVPIGKPIYNTRIYLLDENQNECLENEVGEIYLAGECVARGYVNDDELTQESFLPDLKNKADKMYKSGDLGKWTEKGDLIFIGRADNQVKVRGYRIELEEIEKLLVRYREVTQALVVLHGQNALICYYTSESEIKKNVLIEHLSNFVPDYMIPFDFIKINDFVYNKSGKIDRNHNYSKINENISVEEEDKRQNLSLLEQRIIEIIENNMESASNRQISLDTNLVDIAIYSVQLIQIIVEMEIEFEMEFDDNMLSRKSFEKIQDFVDYIKEKIGQ